MGEEKDEEEKKGVEEGKEERREELERGEAKNKTKQDVEVKREKHRETECLQLMKEEEDFPRVKNHREETSSVFLSLIKTKKNLDEKSLGRERKP